MQSSHRNVATIVGAIGGAVGVALVALVFSGMQMKPGFPAVIAAGLLGLAVAVVKTADYVGERLSQPAAWFTALWLGPANGMLCVTSGALGLASASLIWYGGSFSDYFVKPLLLGAVYGAIPAALIGLLCALAIVIVQRRSRAAA